MIGAYYCSVENTLLKTAGTSYVWHLKSLASNSVNSRPVESFGDNGCSEHLDDEEMSTPTSRDNDNISKRLHELSFAKSHQFGTLSVTRK